MTADLAKFDGAFSANPIGIAPIGVIGSHPFDPRAGAVHDIADLSRKVAPDTI